MIEPRLPSEIFAQRLRETRASRGLSFEALADRMHDAGRPISKATLVRMANGHEGEGQPNLDHALALARILGTSLALLLSPTGKGRVAISGDTALDGATLREWLREGDLALVERGRRRSLSEEIADRMTIAIASDASRNLTAAMTAGDEAGIRDALYALRAVLSGKVSRDDG